MIANDRRTNVLLDVNNVLSARSFCESILFLHLKVQKEAQLTTSERLQVQKENALCMQR